jgi:hypothetical protein
MNTIKMIFILFLFFTFFLGFYVYVSPELYSCILYPNDTGFVPLDEGTNLYPVRFNEGFEEETTTPSETTTPFETTTPSETMDPSEKIHSNQECYNVLMRTKNGLLLFNKFKPKGENNPMKFANLDDYTQFMESEKEAGLNCPVLYLQSENNTQGQDVYRIRPSPYSQEGGLPTVNQTPRIPMDASDDNPPYNQGIYSGFDPYGQHIGDYTTLDAVHNSTAQEPISDNPMDTNWGGVIHSQQMVDSGKYDQNTVGKPIMVPRVIAIQ